MAPKDKDYSVALNLPKVPDLATVLLRVSDILNAEPEMMVLTIHRQEIAVLLAAAWAFAHPEYRLL